MILLQKVIDNLFFKNIFESYWNVWNFFLQEYKALYFLFKNIKSRIWKNVAEESCFRQRAKTLYVVNSKERYKEQLKSKTRKENISKDVNAYEDLVDSLVNQFEIQAGRFESIQNIRESAMDPENIYIPPRTATEFSL